MILGKSTCPRPGFLSARVRDRSACLRLPTSHGAPAGHTWSVFLGDAVTVGLGLSFGPPRPGFTASGEAITGGGCSIRPSRDFAQPPDPRETTAGVPVLCGCGVGAVRCCDPPEQATSSSKAPTIALTRTTMSRIICSFGSRRHGQQNAAWAGLPACGSRTVLTRCFSALVTTLRAPVPGLTTG